MKRKILILGAGWYGCHLAASLLEKGLKAKILKEPVVKYRVQKNNLLGWGNNYDINRIYDNV